MGLLATALLVAGVLTLRRTWGKALRTRALWLAIAWGLIMLGHVTFARTFGAEVGIPAAQLACMLLGLLLVVANLQRTPRRLPRQRTAVADPPATRGRWHKSMRLLLAGPLAALAALSVCMLLARLLPPPAINSIVIAGLSVPFLWATAVLWAVSAQRLRWRPTRWSACCWPR